MIKLASSVKSHLTGTFDVAPVAQRIEHSSSERVVGGSIPSRRTLLSFTLSANKVLTVNTKMVWYLYIVECSDGSYYTGITKDIKRRISDHNQKLGAKSLFGKLPVSLVYQEVHQDQTKAAKREREIKSWRREKKIELIYGLS